MAEQTPTFSVIVPAYNVKAYLAECVASVADQGGTDWECLVVDDGSTDGTGALADELAAQNPGVRALHRENGGLSAARNTGLAAAKGEWVLFLDGDDRMAPGLLAGLRRTLAEEPGFDWYIGRYLRLLPEGCLEPHAGLVFAPGAAEGDFAARLSALYAAGHWSVWKYCLRRAFLQERGLQFREDVRWAEDVGFDLELLAAGARMNFIDLVFTHYRENRAGSLLNDAKNLPRRFTAIAATWRHVEAMRETGALDTAAFAAARDAVADVFWPQARTAAVPDQALRAACLPGLRALRGLYPYGKEVREQRSWRAYQLLLRTVGPKFATWAASLGKGKAR